MPGMFPFSTLSPVRRKGRVLPLLQTIGAIGASPRRHYDLPILFQQSVWNGLAMHISQRRLTDASGALSSRMVSKQCLSISRLINCLPKYQFLGVFDSRLPVDLSSWNIIAFCWEVREFAQRTIPHCRNCIKEKNKTLTERMNYAYNQAVSFRTNTAILLRRPHAPYI